MKGLKYTQGEYVTRFNHGALDMDVFQAAHVKLHAKNIAKEEKVTPGKKRGNRRVYTITLPKEIWEAAYKKFHDEA